MRESQESPESSNVGIRVVTSQHSGGELVWPVKSYGPRPETRHRLLGGEVTLQQLTAVIQDERVRALVSLSFERENLTLNLEEFNELKELLRDAGVPPASFRVTINAVFKYIERRREEVQVKGHSHHGQA